jgi:ABC-type transporter Mla subunit MlaD
LKRQADLISDRSYNPTSDEVDKLLKAINDLQGAIDATDDQANETELKAAEEFQKLKDYIAAASEKSRLDDELQVVAEALGEEMQRCEDILKEFPAEANNLL